MTLGTAAQAHVRLIVWCSDRRHQIEPDPAGRAQRYGANTAVPGWLQTPRLQCLQLRQRRYGRRRCSAVMSVRRGLQGLGFCSIPWTTASGE